MDYKEVIFCDVLENGSGFVYIYGCLFKLICEFFFFVWLYGIVFEIFIIYIDDGFKIMMSGDE